MRNGVDVDIVGGCCAGIVGRGLGCESEVVTGA
jgi:hypothetical protein